MNVQEDSCGQFKILEINQAALRNKGTKDLTGRVGC